LEQAQSIYRSDPEEEAREEVATKDCAEFAFDGDLELLEAELRFNPLSSDGLRNVEMEISGTQNETSSDDLFDTDFDNLRPEDLAQLDSSSNQGAQPTANVIREVMDEDSVLFGDGYDDLINLDLEGIPPQALPP
jgi:hypothetical protein